MQITSATRTLTKLRSPASRVPGLWTAAARSERCGVFPGHRTHIGGFLGNFAVSVRYQTDSSHRPFHRTGSRDREEKTLFAKGRRLLSFSPDPHSFPDLSFHPHRPRQVSTRSHVFQMFPGPRIDCLHSVRRGPWAGHGPMDPQIHAKFPSLRRNTLKQVPC